MASFQGGTNSGYLSAAPYRLNTQLFEDEYEFMSGLPSIFTIQNNYNTKPIFDINKGFTPKESNDNIAIMQKLPQCSNFLRFINTIKPIILPHKPNVNIIIGKT